MSLRNSTSGGENLSMNRNGVRTPLKSLHNDNFNASTESFSVGSKSEQLKLTENVITCVQKNPFTCTDHMRENGCINNDTDVPETKVTRSCVHSNTSVEPDFKHAANYCGDVTLKSYYCDGEVELAEEDSDRAKETIPLPSPEMSENLQHMHIMDSSDIFYCTGYCDTGDENEEHNYCRRASGTILRTSRTDVFDQPQDAVGDITLKYLNCTGGEMEIADSNHTGDRTIPLPLNHNEDHAEVYNEGLDSQIVSEYCDDDHLDHPYCNIPRVCSTRVTNQQSLHDSLNVEVKFDLKHEDNIDAPVLKVEISNENVKIDEGHPMSVEQLCPTHLITSLIPTQQNVHNIDDPQRTLRTEDVDYTFSSDSPSSNNSISENSHEHDTKENLDFDVHSLALPQRSSTTVSSQTDVKERDVTTCESQIHHSAQTDQRSATADSALGLSQNAPVSTEPAPTETLPDVLKAITECTPLNFKFLTPIVRRASLAFAQAQKKQIASQLEGDDHEDKSVVAPNLDQADFWKEHLDSPMSRPLFNSTELVHRSKPATVAEPLKDIALPEPEVNDKLDVDLLVISDGPLQQQLRQMAEFLMMASGKMGPSSVSAPVSKAESQDACVGTSPFRQVNHSVNTSGQFERKRSFTVEDQGTLTDPLHWNLPVAGLESVSRLELEQWVLSSMTIVEALVQQLAAARAQTLSPAGAAPSELRERTVQTEHTELSQTSMHRDLYLKALDRIKELEVDNASLKNLAQHMRNTKMKMTALTGDTNAALHQINKIEELVREEHKSLVSNYGHMKSLLEKSRMSQMRMVQKVKDTLQEKEDMHLEMEKAFTAREAAYSVMNQLRKHCSSEISELEKCVGSQQELLSALKKAYLEQKALSKAYNETLDLASGVLSKTLEEQTSLEKELCRVRPLLLKCTPIIQKLNDKTNQALRDRDKHITERDHALKDKEQIEEELNQALQNLQTAKGQISDLNLQVTILTSEMGVLRQKLGESDEERAQLNRKATELSATVSSTLASYAFLEQALAAESTKLQESWTDLKQTEQRAQELESSLSQSEERVAELSEALFRSESQVHQQQSLSEAQALELQQLQERCSQLSAVQDMNEFLQMENELTREQIAESERMLTANLQSLRERNIQCEDLKAELCQLQHEKKNLLEELDSVRTKFTASQTEHKEKVEQIVTEIALLHHTVRSVTNELHKSLQKENAERPPHNISGRTSALFTKEPEDGDSHVEGSSDTEVRSELVFSACSAFKRVAAVTPRKSLSLEAKEQLSNVSELLSGLDSTITELSNTLSSVQQQKDAVLHDRLSTICGLQRELEAAHSSHRTETSELQFELSRLNARMERAQATLKLKSQDDKTVSKLVADLSEIQEMLNKQRVENFGLHQEVGELRQSLKESKSENQFLHDELRKNGGSSAPPAELMEEKIVLRKEIDKLKMALQNEEQARNKLLERAKKHQVIHKSNQEKSEKELQLLNKVLMKVRETLVSLPDPVKNCDQLQQLLEYVG